MAYYKKSTFPNMSHSILQKIIKKSLVRPIELRCSQHVLWIGTKLCCGATYGLLKCPSFYIFQNIHNHSTSQTNFHSKATKLDRQIFRCYMSSAPNCNQTSPTRWTIYWISSKCCVIFFFRILSQNVKLL